MNNTNSIEIFKKAKKYIPGGVNSPVRAFQSVKREAPIFIKKALGSKLWDEDGNEYIDFICSWGPMILGHNFENVIQGVREAIELGSSYGLPTKLEAELAELIVKCCPSMDKVRLTTSGTEATMSAVRLARAYTNRNKILKFQGCYHGHSDSLLVKSGSGLLTEGYQDSNGITEGVLKDTLTIPFGDIKNLKEILRTREIACLIMEVIPANMGVIKTNVEFLKEIREICNSTGTILIFDEVITGFRISLGGAQEYFGVIPDITTIGKIIGGGYPVGAFGGKSEIMELVAPVGRVYHAGTLSGNPISVRAGFETINYLYKNKNLIYKELEIKTNYITEEIKKLIKKYEISACVNSIGSLFTIFFTEKKLVENLEDALTSNIDIYAEYFNIMLDEGIVIPPSQFEANFISLAHKDEDIFKYLKAAEKAFKFISKKKGKD
ncbi:glutamate-1-semialdehyde 2,1-aminomutase [Fusobacterium sp. MFO224]|uniref:glutamate-1-semialdehyde 2,1-aminomutase n=1 Tax=Fusobacterium sp. MFO224 TaxID=3378070 RepID=UPI003853452D